LQQKTFLQVQVPTHTTNDQLIKIIVLLFCSVLYALREIEQTVYMREEFERKKCDAKATAISLEWMEE